MGSTDNNPFDKHLPPDPPAQASDTAPAGGPDPARSAEGRTNFMSDVTKVPIPPETQTVPQQDTSQTAPSLTGPVSSLAIDNRHGIIDRGPGTLKPAPAYQSPEKYPRWDEVQQNPEFMKLDPVAREQARQQYFQETIAPMVDPKELADVKAQFEETTSIYNSSELRENERIAEAQRLQKWLGLDKSSSYKLADKLTPDEQFYTREPTTGLTYAQLAAKGASDSAKADEILGYAVGGAAAPAAVNAIKNAMPTIGRTVMAVKHPYWAAYAGMGSAAMSAYGAWHAFKYLKKFGEVIGGSEGD